MSYVQFLRLRKSLNVYFIVVGAIFVVCVGLGHLPGAMVNMDLHRDAGRQPSFPMSFLLFLSAWCAIIFATVISTSLNKENDGVEMVWTKPIAREWLAIRYVALDLAAIAIVFASAFALLLLGLASFGLAKFLEVDNRTVPTLGIGLGTAVMWYGLVQGMTSWQRGRGSIVIGISWAAAFVLMTFAGATQYAAPGIHALFLGLDVLNPLAYFSSYSLSGYGARPSPVLPQIFAGTEARALLTWSIGLLGCVAAVAGWKRLEV